MATALKGITGERNGVYYGYALYDLTEDKLIPFSDLNGTGGGTPGPQGPQGIQGPPGPTGAVGPKGDRGAQGAQGVQGNPGAKGDTGAAGPRGEKGDKGDAGPKGDRGQVGPTGATGLNWKGAYSDAVTYAVNDAVSYEGATYFSIQASTGIPPDPVARVNAYWAIMAAQGADGKEGPEGQRGQVGPTGSKGDKGDQGVQGSQGIQGIQGPPGAKGDKGDQGPKGDTGSQGIQGNPGVKGDQGEGLAGITQAGKDLVTKGTTKEMKGYLGVDTLDARTGTGRFVTQELPAWNGSGSGDTRTYMVVGGRATTAEISAGFDGWGVAGTIMTARGNALANNFRAHVTIDFGDNYKTRISSIYKHPDDTRMSDFASIWTGEVDGELVYLVARDTTGGPNNNGAFFTGQIVGSVAKTAKAFRMVLGKDINNLVQLAANAGGVVSTYATGANITALMVRIEALEKTIG